MKWFAWFFAAIFANALNGSAKFFALLVPASILTFMFGTPGYLLGMACLFTVMFADVQAEQGVSFWVEFREVALWGYLLAGTLCILMAEVLTLPMAVAIFAASAGIIWGTDKLAKLVTEKAATSFNTIDAVAANC